MDISVRGWGRDLGKTTLLSASLHDAETLSEGGRYHKGTLYKKVLYPESRRLTRVRISAGTEVRLGGNYLLEVELSRKEIAELFFETHTGSMARMVRAFIEEETRENHARAVERISEIEERRAKRLAERDNSEA